jgi:hypothetical protein
MGCPSPTQKVPYGLGHHLGLFQVGHMATLGNPAQLAAGDRPLKALGILGAQDTVLLSPED